MPNNRLIPAVLLGGLLALPIAWSFGQSADTKAVPPAQAPEAKAADEAPTEAEVLLDEAIQKVSALESVTADLAEKVEMLGQKFRINGRYLKAPQDRVYLKLDVSGLADASGTMLQVCDGTTFWDYQQVFETKIWRKMDAKPILAKVRSSDIGDDLRGQILNQMGFAGPDILLSGLRKTIRFDQKVKGTLDGRPVWILRGRWKSRDGILGPNSQPMPPMAPLPPYIPSLVSIQLGVDDLWPYRVDLTGEQTSMVFDTRPIGPDGRRVGALNLIQKPLLTRIELVYSQVKLNATVPDDEFAFTAPPDAQVEDETKKILDGLEQAVTMRAAQKKADASKVEDPLLNQSIDVPKAGAPEPPTSSKPLPKK